MTRRPPRSTLFPYTTPSRSVLLAVRSEPAPSVEQLQVQSGPRQGVPGQGQAAGTEGEGRLLRLRTPVEDRKSTRLNSSHANISYAVFCLKKKKIGQTSDESI